MQRACSDQRANGSGLLKAGLEGSRVSLDSRPHPAGPEELGGRGNRGLFRGEPSELAGLLRLLGEWPFELALEPEELG